jgi:hypothetical protein
MPKACAECGRPLNFVRTTADKMMPIDPVDVGGNVYLVDGVAHALKKGETMPSGQQYVMHRVTCRQPDRTKVANPLDAVRRIRKEIDEERRGEKQTAQENATKAGSHGEQTTLDTDS